MVELVVMLGPIPWESTLPGWPVPHNPSLALMLLLMLGIPLALAAVFVVVGMASRWRRELTPAAAPAAAPTADAPGTRLGLPTEAHAPTPAIEAGTHTATGQRPVAVASDQVSASGALPPGNAAHAAARPDVP